jgi:hypothetical protein
VISGLCPYQMGLTAMTGDAANLLHLQRRCSLPELSVLMHHSSRGLETWPCYLLQAQNIIFTTISTMFEPFRRSDYLLPRLFTDGDR